MRKGYEEDQPTDERVDDHVAALAHACIVSHGCVFLRRIERYSSVVVDRYVDELGGFRRGRGRGQETVKKAIAFGSCVPADLSPIRIRGGDGLAQIRCVPRPANGVCRHLSHPRMYCDYACR